VWRLLMWQLLMWLLLMWLLLLMMWQLPGPSCDDSRRTL
jgi:hypothetical protein